MLKTMLTHFLMVKKNRFFRIPYGGMEHICHCGLSCLAAEAPFS